CQGNTPCASTGSTCSMVLIRVRPFLFARTMMSFHKILRITERPHRADKSAIIGINLRTSPSTSVGARAMGSGGEGLHGRPRPVPLAHILGKHDSTPPTGDHEGPPRRPSSTL